jgi:hypothetical protein
VYTWLECICVESKEEEEAERSLRKGITKNIWKSVISGFKD